jgi:hypothetical protein
MLLDIDLLYSFLFPFHNLSVFVYLYLCSSICMWLKKGKKNLFCIFQGRLSGTGCGDATKVGYFFEFDSQQDSWSILFPIFV